jgi:hypothetical protein
LVCRYRRLDSADLIALMEDGAQICADYYQSLDPSAWHTLASPHGTQVSETTIPQEIAWRIFTKSMARHEAVKQVRVRGDADRGLHVLATVAIVG